MMRGATEGPGEGGPWRGVAPLERPVGIATEDHRTTTSQTQPELRIGRALCEVGTGCAKSASGHLGPAVGQLALQRRQVALVAQVALEGWGGDLVLPLRVVGH